MTLCVRLPPQHLIALRERPCSHLHASRFWGGTHQRAAAGLERPSGAD